VPEDVALLLLAPLAGMLGNTLLQMTLGWLLPVAAHIRVQFLSFAFGMLVTVIVFVGLLPQDRIAAIDRAGYLLLHVMTYGFLGFCFFNMISANVSSLRVRLLKEYLSHDPMPLADDEIFRRYPAWQILEVRLARLESGRQIYSRAGRYYSRSGPVTFIGWIFAALRRFLLGGSS